jgi:hypothetical protein
MSVEMFGKSHISANVVNGDFKQAQVFASHS